MQPNKAVKHRATILEQERLRLVKVFDTNEHDPNKDVVLAQDKNGQQHVLRIGEYRTPGFYPDGYQGKHFVVPRLVKLVDSIPVPYEIEEHLPGTLLFETIPDPSVTLLYPQEVLVKLVRAFWEFQILASKLPFLRPTWDKQEHIEKFLQKARTLLNVETVKAVESIITGKEWKSFWKADYPCKWKYSADNLILLPDGRLGFIDLVKVSKRFWGYDLGWIFWPRWHHFRDEDYERADDYFENLDSFFNLVFAEAPAEEQSDKKLFFTRCWIVVLERSVGALYDVVNETGHIKKNLPTKVRRDAYVSFVQEVLDTTLFKLKN